MAGRTTTIRSKWVLGGDGTLVDAFPLSPLTKLLIDAIVYLFKHPAIPLSSLVAITTAINTNGTLVNKLAAATLTALLFLIAIALLKELYRRRTTVRNIKYMTKQNVTTPIVPLDISHNRRAVIALDRSILIGGEAGSGKSNLVWKILKEIKQYQIPHSLYVIDPAGGVELADLQNYAHTHAYTDRAKHANGLISKMRDDMDQTLAYMQKHKIRKLTPTSSNPLKILIIDELLLLPNQLAQGVNSPLGEILAVGRKAGYIVIGCTQLGQVDAIGRVRDLFPQRICFATRTSEMTDAILGTHATKDGAACHEIYLPGQGYVFAEDKTSHEKYYQSFRSELITDTHVIATPTKQTSNTLNQTLTLPTETVDLRRTENKRTAVYELFAEDDTPMYVGMTNSPNRRFREHLDTQGWFHQVDLSRTIITWYPTRSGAQIAEEQKIKETRPIYNIVHSFGQD